MTYRNLRNLSKILCRLCLDFNWEFEFKSRFCNFVRPQIAQDIYRTTKLQEHLDYLPTNNIIDYENCYHRTL